MNDDDFYMILPSNCGPTTHPNNTASLFITDLETSIKLQGKWKVALTEFSFNYYSNMVDEDASITYFSGINVTETVNVHYDAKTNVISTNIENPREKDEKIFVVVADGYLEMHCRVFPWSVSFQSVEMANIFGFEKKEYYTYYKSIYSVAKPKLKDAVKPFVDGKVERTYTDAYFARKIVFKEKIQYTTVDQLIEFFKKKCKSVFTDIAIEEDDTLGFGVKEGINQIVFTKYVADVLGFDKTDYKISSKLLKADRVPKIENKSTQLFIYSSIVNPIYVGGILVPLLKSIWVENTYNDGEAVNETPEHVMYIPVSCTTINNIEINIRSDSGRLIKFPYGTKSSITLHFQKYE